MKKKVAVLAYSFSANNAGDFALTVAAIDILIKNNFNIVVISRFKKDDKEYIETFNFYHKHYGPIVRMIESPFYLDRHAGLLRRTINSIHGALVLFNILKNKNIENEIKNADIVFMGAGNLLRCSSFSDYMRLKALYYPLGIANKLNKEFIILPQSTAEVNSYGKPLLAKFLNKAKVVFIREELSFLKLKKIFPESNLVQTLDLAFFLQNKKLFKSNNSNVKKIALTVRLDGIGGLRKFSDEEKEEIITRIFNVINTLKDVHDFIFIVQAPHRDREFTEFLQKYYSNKLGVNIPIVEEHDPIKLVELYSSFDLLIGMRLHSIILAACGGTPSYGLFFREWGLKNPGILDSLNLPYTMVDDKKDIDITKLNKLLNEKEVFQSRVKNIYNVDAKKFEKILNDVL